MPLGCKVAMSRFSAQQSTEVCKRLKEPDVLPRTTDFGNAGKNSSAEAECVMPLYEQGKGDSLMSTQECSSCL